MTEEEKKKLVDRFLCWPLPKSVCSDLCVTEHNYYLPRFGTSLLTADEAKQMFDYLFNSHPEQAMKPYPKWTDFPIEKVMHGVGAPLVGCGVYTYDKKFSWPDREMTMKHEYERWAKHLTDNGYEISKEYIDSYVKEDPAYDAMVAKMAEALELSLIGKPEAGLDNYVLIVTREALALYREWVGK